MLIISASIDIRSMYQSIGLSQILSNKQEQPPKPNLPNSRSIICFDMTWLICSLYLTDLKSARKYFSLNHMKNENNVLKTKRKIYKMRLNTIQLMNRQVALWLTAISYSALPISTWQG